MIQKFAVAKALFLFAFLRQIISAESEACNGDCGEDKYCVHNSCEKYRCEHITHGDSLKYQMPQEIAYCCAHGFILKSLCTDNLPTSTAATATVKTTSATTTTKTEKIVETTTSQKNFPTETSEKSCATQAKEPGKYLLTGMIVVKGLSPELEETFKRVFRSIFIACPVLVQLKCDFSQGSPATICEYNLQYTIKRDIETQRMLLNEVAFSSTINSELKDHGEQLKVTQHVPPKSIFEIENESSDDLIMIVAIISAVSAGGVLLLVVIAIVAFAMIASRSPDEEEEEEEVSGQLEVARVVASTSPGYDRPVHHHRAAFDNDEIRTRVSPNTVSLDMNDAYDHNMTETEDDDFDDMVDSMTSERNGSDSNYSC